MRILFVASDAVPHTGGKSTHIVDLMDGMQTLGVQVGLLSFASLGRWRELFLKARFVHDKLFNQRVFAENVSLAWGRQLNHMLAKTLSDGDYDIVSFQDAVAASASAQAIRGSGVKTVLTMHTYFGLENALDGGRAAGDPAYQRRLERELGALDLVDGVVAVDQRIYRHVVETWRTRSSCSIDNRVLAIGNFADTDIYKPPSPGERQVARSAFSIAEDEFAISCIRRLVEKNGVINAVAAMEGISARNVVLLVAGDGPQQQDLTEFVAKRGLSNRVRFLGSLDRATVRQLLYASDASVIPSITVGGLQEATSIAAIESMACGVPTIASDIGGLTELIDGKTSGLLVPEGDPRALSDAIERVIHEPGLGSHLSHGGRYFVEANHSHVKAAGKYVDMFSGLQKWDAQNS